MVLLGLCSDFSPLLKTSSRCFRITKCMAVNGGCLFLVAKEIRQTIKCLYQTILLLLHCLSFLYCSWAKCSGRSDIHSTFLSALGMGDQCSFPCRRQQKRGVFLLVTCHPSQSAAQQLSQKVSVDVPVMLGPDPCTVLPPNKADGQLSLVRTSMV